MSHFAKVNNGIVVQVIVAEPEFFNTFVDTSPGQWIQTSYNTHGGQHPEGRPLHKNYAGISYTWDGIGFAPPQPFPSWTKNPDTYLWEPPVPMPTTGMDTWSEETLSWVAVPTV